MPQLLLVSLIWAFSFGLVKHFLAGVDGAFVAAARVALALVVFLPFLRPRAVAGGHVLRLAGIGAVQFGLMYVAYLSAFAWLQAYQVALMSLTTPVLVCLCDDALERRVRWAPLAAALVAVLGTAIVVANKPLGDAAWKGVALMQASNLCFAVGQVLYRRWKLTQPAVRDRDVFAWLYLGAVAAAVPFAFARVNFATLSLTPTNWGVLLYLGVLASGLGFFLWNSGATRVATGTLAVLNNAKTPLAVAASLLVFGEQPDFLRLALGGGIIFAAALWAERTGRTKS